MAFVPGHKHDLFLSYAHDEAVWADAFRKALCTEFHVRTGAEVTVWQDSQKLRVGQKWADEIEVGIRTAAAFLAIVSPIYMNSWWCRKERAVVLEKKLEALKVDSLYRFLKVVKTPGSEDPVADLQDIRFFNPADGYEHPEGSPEFTATIRALARDVRELLTLLSNKAQEIYVAPPETSDMRTEREELIRELKDRGFTIKPDYLLDPWYGKDAIRRAMDKVTHVIFILCVAPDDFTSDQIEVAQELGRPVVYWTRPGSAVGLPELPAGSERLGGRSIRELIPQLLEKLKPRETPEPAPSSTGAAQVYLNYDTTLPEDARIAERIAVEVSDRKLEVLRSARDGGHEQRMRSANAVLVIRAAHPHPDEWLKLNAMELVLAKQIYQKDPDFLAKGLLVADPARLGTMAAGVPLYAWSDRFSPQTLEPFFEKLRAADAGR